MKLKHRALTLLLILAILLTFMPAMTFAEGEEGGDSVLEANVSTEAVTGVTSWSYTPAKVDYTENELKQREEYYDGYYYWLSNLGDKISITTGEGTTLYTYKEKTTNTVDGYEITEGFYDESGNDINASYEVVNPSLWVEGYSAASRSGKYTCYVGLRNKNADDDEIPDWKSFTITVTSNADIAAAAAEAARQGTPDGSMPKAKASKPSAGKKSVTVKWKKLTKKQLKKSKATNMEIWVCPNNGFGASDTIMKNVGKKKGSVKVKGLAKGTYFVKVRAIKYVGGTKMVGQWSKVKKVKVKK